MHFFVLQLINPFRHLNLLLLITLIVYMPGFDIYHMSIMFTVLMNTLIHLPPIQLNL